MFNKRDAEELKSLTPEALEEKRKQRSLNRLFGLFCVVALILIAIIIFEIATISK